MGLNPVKNGFVQDTYADFMGQAVNGMLANASDVDLCDGLYVGDVEKAYAGRCYGNDHGVLKALTATDEPVICVFTQSMDSDTDGNFYDGVAKCLRSARVGGRVWVEVTATGTTVTPDTALKVASTGAFTDGDGVDVSSVVKVCGTFAVTDSKALVLVEVL